MLAQGCISGMHTYQKTKYRNNIYKKIKIIGFLVGFVFLKVAYQISVLECFIKIYLISRREGIILMDNPVFHRTSQTGRC